MQQFDKQPPHVILYTRPGCHLCEEVEDLLAQLADETALRITMVSILSDPELYERYKWSIPVAIVEGGATLSAPIDAAALRRAIGL